MKVKDLIEHLSKCNLEATVAVPYPEYSFNVPVVTVTQSSTIFVNYAETGEFKSFADFPATNPLYYNTEGLVVFLSGEKV